MRPNAVHDSRIRILHFAFDEDEFVRIVIENVVLDSHLATICLSRDEWIAREAGSRADVELTAGGCTASGVNALLRWRAFAIAGEMGSK